jgi:hypothetical protein
MYPVSIYDASAKRLSSRYNWINRRQTLARVSEMLWIEDDGAKDCRRGPRPLLRAVFAPTRNYALDARLLARHVAWMVTT